MTVDEATENAAMVILSTMMNGYVDDFLKWYKPEQWLGIHRAVAAYLVTHFEPKGGEMNETDIYDFAGWLTTRDGSLIVGSKYDAAPMAEAVGEYIKTFPDRFAKLDPAKRERVKELLNGELDTIANAQDLRCKTVLREAAELLKEGWGL